MTSGSVTRGVATIRDDASETINDCSSALVRLLSGHAAPGEADPDALLAVAEAEGVTGLVFEALQRSGARHDILGRFGVRSRAAIAAEVLIERELTRVLAALDRGGVRVLVLKGAALAYTMYPHPWLRPRVDTDLLVHAEDDDRAASMLAGLGYSPVTTVSSGALVSHQRVFEHVDAHGVRHLVDLHWKIVNPQMLANALSFDELWATSEQVPTLCAPARAPNPVTALVLACIHRLAHHQGRDRLIWLYDIHILASRFVASDWETLCQLAEAHQVAGLCSDGLGRTAAVFGTQVPDRVASRLSAAGMSEPSRAYTDGRVHRRDVLLSDLSMLPRWRDRLRLLREHAFPPPSFMLDRYRVRSRAWLPLLYAHRLITGSCRWIRP